MRRDTSYGNSRDTRVISIPIVSIPRKISRYCIGKMKRREKEIILLSCTSRAARSIASDDEADGRIEVSARSSRYIKRYNDDARRGDRPDDIRRRRREEERTIVPRNRHRKPRRSLKR